MILQARTAEFERFLAAAEAFWRDNVMPVRPGSGPADVPWIVTESLHQDIRVSLRNLTLANALRRLFPARLLVITGTDDDWYDALWSGFDVDKFRRLARAYGADAVLDVHAAVDARLAAGSGAVPDVVVGDVVLPGRAQAPAIPAEDFGHVVDATACRVLRVPRLSAEHRAGPAYDRVLRRSREFTGLYDALVEGLRPAAFVTSHVDYNHWGLAVEAAMRGSVPVLHTQSTGSLKAYALFPEQRAHRASKGHPTFRAELTRQIGEYFEKHLWAERRVLHRSAELVAYRAKGNLGRPSWWRGGASASMELSTPVERAQLRMHAQDRLGLERGHPGVTVFNHAVSDALNTNVETFDDLAGWFEETAAYAATRTDTNWLFLDHPSQALYDVTGFFDTVAARYADRPHMAFRPSRALSKNLLWSLTDLGVTVRGSVSNELPAYGIPALQAGWSEWSHCGLSDVAADREDFLARLDRSIDRLHAGDPLVTAEQTERARLWHWFYRSGNDVTSPLVPHWDIGPGDGLLRAVRTAMSAMEPDADPVFTATRRMWERREPFLTRLDLAGGGAELARRLAPVGPVEDAVDVTDPASDQESDLLAEARR